MIRRNTGRGSFLLFVSALLCYGGIRLGIGKSNYPGPGLFPFLGGITLGILSVIMMISSSRDSLNPIQKAEPLLSIQAALILAILLIFGVFVEKAGFFVCTFFTTFFLLKVISTKKWPFLLFVSIVTCIGIFLLFNLLLDVRLPLGILEPIFRGM